VSELFPLEIRATAIAIFFVISQGVGAFGPWLFSHLIETSAQDVFFGDLVGAVAMLIGFIVALRFGVNAEKQPLEDIAPPLSCRNNQSESGSPEIPV
jgi:MFS-type transporter involved in bile tolerance (Atg22 family)